MAGALPRNIMHFTRFLRRAGFSVGPYHSLQAIEALQVVDFHQKEDFFFILQSIFVKKPEERVVFKQAFELYFQKLGKEDAVLSILSPSVETEKKKEPEVAEARLNEALFSKQDEEEKQQEYQQEIVALSPSTKDILRQKDFAQMSLSEQQEAKREIASLKMPIEPIATRRFKKTPSGRYFDFRSSISGMMRSHSDIILPQFREYRNTFPPLVVLCDISGSMRSYSRLFLHFLHGLSGQTVQGQKMKVQSFLFGTRLTNITRELSLKDADEAVKAVSDKIEDWEGGTRIATALKRFNYDWSRRVLNSRATVLLITDGLERDGEDDLAHEMKRLHRSSKRLIWLNPLLRFDGFEARAKGVRTMLRYVDDFRPVHSIDSLTDLCQALSLPNDKSYNPRNWL